MLRLILSTYLLFGWYNAAIVFYHNRAEFGKNWRWGYKWFTIQLILMAVLFWPYFFTMGFILAWKARRATRTRSE